MLVVCLHPAAAVWALLVSAEVLTSTEEGNQVWVGVVPLVALEVDTVPVVVL